jgi:hypothetical protein
MAEVVKDATLLNVPERSNDRVAIGVNGEGTCRGVFTIGKK